MESIDYHIEEELWKLEGNCLDDPINIYFESYEDYPEVASRVDAVCAACPVRQQCLDYAIQDDLSGVWGGRYLVLGKYSRSRNSHKPRPQMLKEEEEVNNAR